MEVCSVSGRTVTKIIETLERGGLVRLGYYNNDGRSFTVVYDPTLYNYEALLEGVSDDLFQRLAPKIASCVGSFVLKEDETRVCNPAPPLPEGSVNGHQPYQNSAQQSHYCVAKGGQNNTNLRAVEVGFLRENERHLICIKKIKELKELKESLNTVFKDYLFVSKNGCEVYRKGASMDFLFLDDGGEEKVKNPRALKALREGIERHKDDKTPYADFPEWCWPYLKAYCDANKTIPLKREIAYWIEGFQEMMDLGLSSELIPRAYAHMREVGLSIGSPRSLITVMRNMQSDEIHLAGDKKGDDEYMTEEDVLTYYDGGRTIVIEDKEYDPQIILLRVLRGQDVNFDEALLPKVREQYLRKGVIKDGKAHPNRVLR